MTPKVDYLKRKKRGKKPINNIMNERIHSTTDLTDIKRVTGH